MTVRNDKALDIALGNTRKTKTWKNKPVQWSELLDRLSKTTRTPPFSSKLITTQVCAPEVWPWLFI